MRGCRGDDGFSLIEVVVGVVILVLLLVSSELVIENSLNGVSVSKEYTIATGLLKADMAESVALPFADLESGLNPSANCGNPSANCLANDPNIVKSGSNYVLELNGSIQPTASSIIPVCPGGTCNTNPSEAPIVPQISRVTPQPGITYTVHTYPTISSSCSPTTQSCVVTVVGIITWALPQGGTGRLVGEEGIATP